MTTILFLCYINKHKKNIDQVFLEIDIDQCSLSLYNLDKSYINSIKPEIINISSNKICELLKSMISMEFIVDKKTKKVLNKDKKQVVERLRFSLPNCLLQIDYEDALRVILELDDVVEDMIRTKYIKRYKNDSV